MTLTELPKPRARTGRRPNVDTVAVVLRSMDEEKLARLAEQLDGLPVPGVRMNEDDFVKWAFEHVNAEWVNGEVTLMAPVSDAHDDLEKWLSALLYQFVESKGLGVVKGDMFVRLARRRTRRVPDLMYVSNARRHRIRPTYVDGAPDFVVEIVSIDSRNRDRRDKYLDYEAGGVREYWIVDPLSQTFDAYALRGRKFQEILPVEGRIDSRVLPGVFIRTKWLFGRSRPKVAQVLKEFGGKD